MAVADDDKEEEEEDEEENGRVAGDVCSSKVWFARGGSDQAGRALASGGRGAA